MTESECHSLVQVIATIEWTQLWILCLQQYLQRRSVCNNNTSCIVFLNGQLTQDRKRLENLNSLTSCLTLFRNHTAGEHSRPMKTEGHDDSGDLQWFLDSAAVQSNGIEFNNFNLRPQPVALQLLYAPCSSASKCKSAQSSWTHDEVDQIVNVE